MAGTIEGNKKAAETNKKKYGSDFYAKIGAMGGKKGRTGGFAYDRKLASEAGKKGAAVRKAMREEEARRNHNTVVTPRSGGLDYLNGVTA